MNFGEALQALKESKKVKRESWGGYWLLAENATVYFTQGFANDQQDLNPTILAVLKDDGGVAPAQPYQCDLLAEDWQIVD